MIQATRAGAVPRPRRRPSLARNIGLPLAATLLLNGLIFALDLNRPGPAEHAPFAPPGEVIGAVWIVLIGLLGAARWQLSGILSPEARKGELWTTILIAACLAYPLYTVGFSDPRAGLVGTGLTITLALLALFAAWRAKSSAGMLILPTVLWTLYAFFIVLWNVRHT